MGATNTNAKEVLAGDLPGCGLKIFMGSSTGDLLVDDPEALELYFKAFKGVIATHCEEESIIRKTWKPPVPGTGKISPGQNTAASAAVKRAYLLLQKP